MSVTAKLTVAANATRRVLKTISRRLVTSSSDLLLRKEDLCKI